MKLSKAQQQKKKHAKELERKKKLKEKALILGNMLLWPLVEAYIFEEDEEWQGIGYIVFIRRSPEGLMLAIMLLADSYCLGVKNAFKKILPPDELEAMLMHMNLANKMKSVSPSYAATYADQLIEYARNIGFSPHPDYFPLKKYIEGIPLDPSLNFTFGNNGKPFYFCGPHDSIERQQSIIKTLEKNCGKDNFHFVIHRKDSDDAENDDLFYIGDSSDADESESTDTLENIHKIPLENPLK